MSSKDKNIEEKTLCCQLSLIFKLDLGVYMILYVLSESDDSRIPSKPLIELQFEYQSEMKMFSSNRKDMIEDDWCVCVRVKNRLLEYEIRWLRHRQVKCSGYIIDLKVAEHFTSIRVIKS